MPKRGPPISEDELRQLGEASLRFAVQQLYDAGYQISAHLSCQCFASRCLQTYVRVAQLHTEYSVRSGEVTAAQRA